MVTLDEDTYKLVNNLVKLIDDSEHCNDIIYQVSGNNQGIDMRPEYRRACVALANYRASKVEVVAGQKTYFKEG